MPDNVYKLKDNIFVCRTQDGFKKAIRAFAESNVTPHNHPKEYPCLVVFNWNYNGGGHDLCCSCLPMDVLRDVVDRDQIEITQLAVTKHLGMFSVSNSLVIVNDLFSSILERALKGYPSESISKLITEVQTLLEQIKKSLKD